MKFDYIIGNPPYQYPTGVNSSKKLYMDITKKMIRLTDHISFITPSIVLIKSSKNTIYNFLENNIITVDYTANDYFDIGQKVCLWTTGTTGTTKSTPTETRSIKVIDKNTRTVTRLQDVSRDKDILLRSIINKMTRPGKRLQIRRTDSTDINNDDFVEDYFEGSQEVYTYKAKNIQYSHKNVKGTNHDIKLLFPFIGQLQRGAVLTKLSCSHSFLSINIKNLKNSKIWHNI